VQECKGNGIIVYCEGTEKVTSGGGGVNGSQSKFLDRTWPMSQN
jgi:hypothetical protein